MKRPCVADDVPYRAISSVLVLRVDVTGKLVQVQGVFLEISEFLETPKDCYHFRQCHRSLGPTSPAHRTFSVLFKFSQQKTGFRFGRTSLRENEGKYAISRFWGSWHSWGWGPK
jgi:hypothetical protein